MKQDKKKVYIISISILVTLIIALFVPILTGRIWGAIILLPCAIICLLLIKKRNVLSINTNQIIMSVMGIVYLVLYYLSIFRFGYVKTGYGLKWENIIRLIIPILTIIVSSEISAPPQNTTTCEPWIFLVWNHISPLLANVQVI